MSDYHARHLGGGLIALYRGDEEVREIGITPGWHFKDRDESIARYNRDAALQSEKARADAAEAALREERERLDYIERTFSGMTNRERYLPVQMIWGKACNGRTLREACDKYMAREGKQDAS